MSNVEQLPAIAKAWRELALEGSRFVRSREAAGDQTADNQSPNQNPSQASETTSANGDERR